MEREKLIRRTMAAFTEIQRKLTDPSFKFHQGGASFRAMSDFIDLFEKEFGAVTDGRLVDFCVCTAYAYRNRKQWTVRQAFGPSSIRRLAERSRGAKHHEDLWLSGAGLSREILARLVSDRKEHPQSKYIYVHSEESTKKRCANQEVGYLLCQTSTLGWSPASGACRKCVFTERCKKETQVKYPELYRIRTEYGQNDE